MTQNICMMHEYIIYVVGARINNEKINIFV